MVQPVASARLEAPSGTPIPGGRAERSLEEGVTFDRIDARLLCPDILFPRAFQYFIIVTNLVQPAVAKATL